MSKQYSIIRSFSQTIGRAAACLVALFIFTAMAGAAIYTVDTPHTKSVSNTRTVGNQGTLTDTLFRAYEYEVFGETTFYNTLTAINYSNPVTTFSPAATFPVLNTNDSGAGSLRQAITNANATAGADTISFDIADAGPHVIQLASVLPAISESVNILNTSDESVTVRGNGSTGGFRVFRINLGEVTIRNLIISNGYTDNYGGGIYNGSSGRLTLLNSTVSGNTAFASGGGGIANYGGNLVVVNSTVSGNSAYQGGGIWSWNFTNSTYTTTISNSTVNGNTAGWEGGNIYANETRITLRSSIVANGTATWGPDIESNAGIVSEGYNLIEETSGIQTTLETANAGTNIYGLDPNLGPLANNGGTTHTHALLGCSPAIDKGKNFSGSTTDQRGLTRTVNGVNYPNATGGDGTDIGSFEVQQPDAPTAPTVTINQAAGQSDPTGSSPINFTVVFSQSVSNFATGDVALSGTAGATTATVTGSGTTYNVAVSGMTFDGTVIASINAGVATGCSGTANTASTSTDNTVQYNAPDTTAPTVISIDDGDADNTVQINETLTYTVTFSKDINASTVTASDFDNGATTSPATITIGTITETTPTSGVFTVRVTPTTNGSIDLRIPTAADIRDTLNNRLVTPTQHNTIVTVGLFDLTVTKTHTGNFTQGGVGTYTIIAKNSGGGAYSGTIIVTDFLPDGLTVKNIPVVIGWNCATDTLFKAFSCDRTGVLAAGASYPSITFTVDVAANAPSSVTNTVSVSGSGETNRGNNTASDLTIINAVPKYAISGKVTNGGTGLSGVSVALTGTSSASTTTDASGNYSFSNLIGGNYTVTPSLNGYTFVQSSITVNNLSADQSNQNFATSAASYEGDVATRPSGDGSVDIFDMIATGNLIANLPNITPLAAGGEYQRADAAPRSTKGDGAIDVQDLVIMGLYAAAVNPLTPAGGPTAPIPAPPGNLAAGIEYDTPIGRDASSKDSKADDASLALAMGAVPSAGTATISAGAVTASNGTAIVPIQLTSSNIGAVQFSVTYDSTKLSIPSDAAITDQAGNTLFTFNNTTPGQLGVVALRSPAGTAFPASTVLFNINFTVISGAAGGVVTIGFGGTPVPVKASDPGGEAAAQTTLTPGAVTVIGATAASVSISGRVTAASGRGIRNVQLTMIDSQGRERTAQTTSFGYYRFDNVEAGETVTLSVKARRYKFSQSTIVRTTNESITDADFVSEQ
jgi:uncharacterized repeat protein (TIGR01451 family)